MRMTPDAEESIRCSVCSCVCFKPGSVRLRSCDRCGHGWVAHALGRLQALPPSGCGPVEVALPGLVFDLSSLVLYGAQAVPVRLKILLDRLYSVLTPEQVGHILNTLGWSLGDYVRGYMLQFPSGKVLNRWLTVTPEEEVLILKQFLRFGETRPIVELMTLQRLEAANRLPDPEPKPAPKSCQSNRGTPTMLRNQRGDSRLVAGLCGFERNGPSDHGDAVHHFENFPGGLSLLLPFHFGSSALHCLVPPTKELVPPGKLTQCLRKPSETKLAERHKQEGGRREEDSDQVLQQVKDEPALKIKTDPDKLNPPRSLWQLNSLIHHDQELLEGETEQENTTSSPLYPPISSSSSSPLRISQKMRGSPPPSPHPLPSFSSSFLCPLPTSTFPSSLRPPPSSSSSLHPLPSSLCSLPSPSPAGGRKGRVCCGVCGKSFYDKGTLKIHYNAVHLKIKHRCTVAGCTMVFSSLRSRNRHSANPNPRLHTGTSRDANAHRNPNCDHTSIRSEAHEVKQANRNMHDAQTRMCRESTLWQQGDGAHKLNVPPVKNGLNGCQNNTPPQADSPPSSPYHSFTLTNHQASPPPLLPAHSAPFLGLPSSLVPLVALDKTERCRHLAGPPVQPCGSAHFDGQSMSHGVTEAKQREDHTNQQWRWESADVTPKKKPRKSSMPVKIEREAMESRKDEDEEG